MPHVTPSPPARIAPYAFAFECGLILVAALLGWGFGFSPLSSLRNGEPGWGDDFWAGGIGVLCALPPMASLWAFQRVSWPPVHRLRKLVSEQVVPLFAGVSVVEFALISAAAGIGEELLFRGFLQDGLAQWWGTPYGVWIGLTLASIAFGLVHSLSTGYAILATAMGIYLGLVFHFSGHVLAPIVTHALYDFVALVFLTRVSGRGDGLEP